MGMSKTFIGFDNGVSGSIGVISESGYLFVPMPIKKQQNYTKAKKDINRIDVLKLSTFFDQYMIDSNAMVLIERPMVNPGRFQATMSAIRALEAVIIFLESRYIPFNYIDSKEWQRELLPKGAEKEELKRLSADIGRRLFPLAEETINKQKDADGLLIAEYCRRKFS